MDNELVELSERARADAINYPKKRYIFSKLEEFGKGRIFLGLVGPRGVGKTVLIKQLLSSRDKSFYVSLDEARLSNGIYPLAKELSDKGIECLFIDEIHTVRDFKKDLKKIYDFLKINIIFTSSCSISLYDSVVDLSRRVRTVNIPPLSFREFLYFRKDASIDKMKLDDLVDAKRSKENYGKLLNYEYLFDEYLSGGSYPFTAGHAEIIPLFKNILTTILTRDIFYTEDISSDDQFEIEKMLRFIGRSPAEDISYSSISTNLKITKYTAGKYVSIMEKAFVLNQVFPKGTNVTKEPKILFSPPYRLLYKDFEDCVGSLREDFFVEAVKAVGYDVSYLKSLRGKKIPDYKIDDIIFEIGGTGKGPSQFKGVKEKKKIILTHPGILDEMRRPLFFVGML